MSQSSSYQGLLNQYVSTQNSTLPLPTVSNPVVAVKDINGKIMNMMASQASSQLKAYATNIIPPSSAYQNALVSGSQINWNITTSSILSDCLEIAFHFVIYNGNAQACQLFATPSWVNRLEFKLGSQTVQQFYTSDLIYYNHIYYTSNQFDTLATIEDLTNQNYPALSTINGLSQAEYMLLIPFNVLAQTNLFAPAISQVLNLNMYMNGQADTIFALNGGAASSVQINNCWVEVITQHLSLGASELKWRNYRSGNMALGYSWLINEEYAISNATGGSSYNIILDSFNGLITYFQFVLGIQSATGLDRYLTLDVGNKWDLLDEVGWSYFNQTYGITSNESLLWNSLVVNKFTELNEFQSIFTYPFTSNPSVDLQCGKVSGAIPMNGKSRLVLNTAAAVSKVITISFLSAGVAATAASGYYRLVYYYYGSSYQTNWLAFNASAANIEAAIAALPIFQYYNQTVVVNQAVSAGNSITITYDDIHQLQYTEADFDAVFVVESQLLTGGAAAIYANSAVTRHAADGFPALINLNVIMQGTQSRFIDIDANGGVSVRQT